MSSLWVKVEANMVDHPKMIGISGEAKWSLLEMILYSQSHLTDGFIDERVASRKWSEEAVGELLSNDPVNPSISKTDGGYQIHNYTDYQRSAEEVESILESKRAAGAKGGRASGEARRIKAEANAKQNEANAKQTRSKTKPDTEADTYADTESLKTNDRFDEFWTIWPRKEAKAKARTAYARALKKISEPELLAKAREYVDNPYRPELTFVPHATSWLNGERWNDPLAGDVREKRVIDRFGRKIFYDENGIARGPNDWQQPDGRWVTG